MKPCLVCGWALALSLVGCLAWAADNQRPDPADAPAPALQQSFEDYFQRAAPRAFFRARPALPASLSGSRDFLRLADDRLQAYLGEFSLPSRMAVYGFASGLVFLGLAAGILYFLGLRLRSRREELTIRYQQEMLKMVRDLSGSPGFGPTRRTGKPAPVGTPDVIEPILPALAQGVVPLPEIHDPVFQLVRLIFTGGLKESALAAVRLLKLEPNRGVNIIGEILRAEDPLQRETMAIALGEYYHPQTAELLGAALNDPEPKVAMAACRALARLLRLPQTALPDEARCSIKIRLEQAPPGLHFSLKKGGAL